MNHRPELGRRTIDTVIANPVRSSASFLTLKAMAQYHARIQDSNNVAPLKRIQSQVNAMWRRIARYLVLAAVLSAQALQVQAQENGCASISGENLITLNLDWYSVPPISGGIALPVHLAVDEAYAYQPMFALGGPAGSTALFQMNYLSGQPVPYQEQVKPMKSGHLMLLMTAHGYARPEYGLASFSDTFSGPPLTWPEYQRTGSMLSDFWEIRVEGHADYYLEGFDVAAEFAPDGSMTALLSCAKPTSLFKYPTCAIRESVGRWGTQTTFLRSDLNALPEIRQRVTNFISCIDQGDQN